MWHFNAHLKCPHFEWVSRSCIIRSSQSDRVIDRVKFPNWARSRCRVMFNSASYQVHLFIWTFSSASFAPKREKALLPHILVHLYHKSVTGRVHADSARQGVDYIAVSILVFNSSRARGAMPLYGRAYSVGVYQFVALNSSQMQVEAGMERGWWGGGAGTAAPPAAVRKPRKNINLSKRSLWVGLMVGFIEIANLCSGPSLYLPLSLLGYSCRSQLAGNSTVFDPPTQCDTT